MLPNELSIYPYYMNNISKRLHFYHVVFKISRLKNLTIVTHAYFKDRKTVFLFFIYELENLNNHKLDSL